MVVGSRERGNSVNLIKFSLCVCWAFLFVQQQYTILPAGGGEQQQQFERHKPISKVKERGIRIRYGTI